MKRLFFFILLATISISSYSYSVYSGYVGSTIYLSGPSVASNIDIYSVQWSSREISLSITHAPYNAANVKINAYYTETAVVECDYYYTIGTGVNMRAGHGKVSYGIKCNPVAIKVNKPNITLYPGEGEYISYTLSPTISPTPTVRFTSDNANVATVNSTGYVSAKNPGNATITISTNAGPDNYCYVTVKDIPVTSASISSQINIECDVQTPLSVTTYPYNAAVYTKDWRISSGSDYISLSSSGVLTGKKPGLAYIYCLVNGTIQSNMATVNVSEPAFKKTSTSPANNATNVSAFVNPSITYSLAIYKGDNFANIILKDDAGQKVEGTASISGNSIVFAPTHPLAAQSNYTLVIPARAVKNKWNTHYNQVESISFRTGDYTKLSLYVSTKERFLPKGEWLILTVYGTNVSIYYTLDGSTPTENSTKYEGAIVLEHDIKLRAVAMGLGYENSDILSQDYYISNVDIISKFPDENTKLFEYKDINPHVTFSNGVEAGANIENVKLKKSGEEEIEGDVIAADSSIFFIPYEPLEVGKYYTMIIPEEAIRTPQGEPNAELSWSFSTGDFVTSIAMGGPELAMAFKTDESLLTWGNLYQSGNASNGSYTMKSQVTPAVFMSEKIESVSSGYMHHAFIKPDGSLWMWGRQYCGEFGNKSNVGSSTPIKIMEDVSSVSCGGQTTAIIKTDGLLWMCGRNDFGQLGDSSVVYRNEPVLIMENVHSVAAGWCSTYAVKTDGSLWGWGRNDKHQLGIENSTEDQLLPVYIMDDVENVFVSATESQWVAAIKKDGGLWVWGQNQPTPQKIMDDVRTVAIGVDYIEAIKSDGTLWAHGKNQYGQLGDGSLIASTNPKKIMEDVSYVVSGGQTTMIVKQDGSVWTWGRNNTGLLGDSSMVSMMAFRAEPKEVIEGRNPDILQGLTSRKQEYRMLEGSTNVIDFMPIPLNANYTDLYWESEDNSIVGVSEYGVITAKSIGQTDITATIRNNLGIEYTMISHVIVEDSITTVNPTLSEDQVRIWTFNHDVYITGVQQGQYVNVYTAYGLLYFQDVAHGPDITIPIYDSGIYVVRVGENTAKVFVR